MLAVWQLDLSDMSRFPTKRRLTWASPIRPSSLPSLHRTPSRVGRCEASADLARPVHLQGWVDKSDKRRADEVPGDVV